MNELNSRAKWPSSVIVGAKERRIVSLLRDLGNLLDRLANHLHRMDTQKVNNAPEWIEARRAVLDIATAIVLPPQILLGVVAIVRIEPYWRSHLLLPSSDMEYLESVLDIEGRELLLEAMSVDTKIRELDSANLADVS